MPPWGVAESAAGAVPPGHHKYSGRQRVMPSESLGQTRPMGRWATGSAQGLFAGPWAACRAGDLPKRQYGQLLRRRRLTNPRRRCQPLLREPVLLDPQPRRLLRPTATGGAVVKGLSQADGERLLMAGLREPLHGVQDGEIEPRRFSRPGALVACGLPRRDYAMNPPIYGHRPSSISARRTGWTARWPSQEGGRHTNNGMACLPPLVAPLHRRRSVESAGVEDA